MVRYISLIYILLFFSGCLAQKELISNTFQTNAATSIQNDYKSINKHIIEFKKKLDKRNPYLYDKKLSKSIYSLISKLENNFLLKYKNNTLDNYKDYLQIAFSKDYIPCRNDYLILGLYYLVYDLYDIEDSHKVIALEYDKNKLHKLYKNLQVIKWKIKVNRDFKGNYLFKTWQNNWQLELDKKIQHLNDISYSELKDLKYIKDEKESLLDPSNFSFEILLTQMIDNVSNSLRALGEEPRNLTIGTIKSIFLFF